MTYFHTGPRTIIGAKSFHCPVRDGKEWSQLAMVIRHKGLPVWPWWPDKRIHRVSNQLVLCSRECIFLTASAWHNKQP